MKRKTSLAFFAVALVIIAVSAYFLVSVSAQTADPQVSDDAIGVRIIPNPSHYSVYRWYESQGFKGSPQALTVDGYEALRDGRTVYVNAAYIDTFSKQIYTNIYLISYNQDPNIKTVDILGQIISHWKFNENLRPEASTCSISALKCAKDSDCSSAQTCSTANATCILKTVKNCEVDTDCPANFFCDSTKSKIIRDLKRVGKIEEMKEALAVYKSVNGRYPLLSGGTYLPGKTTSLWPSWNEVLMPALGIKQTIIDPINRLGMCPNYDSKTCWNNSDKKFVYDPVGSMLKLPKDSYAMSYSTNDSGSEYNLCAAMESHDEPNYTLFPNDPIANSNCISATGILASGNVSNATPRIIDVQLKGTSGREYNGFVRADDSDKDPLTWTMSYVSTSWPNWSSRPTIKMVSDSNQRKIFADKAGDVGKYSVRITVTDAKGASVSTTTEIEIVSAASFAQADDYTYHLDQTVPFSYSAYISGNTWSTQVISGPNILVMPGIVTKTIADGLNRKKFIIQGIISTSTVFTTDTETVYRLIVDGKAANNFVIRVKVDKPILKLDCPTQSRVGYAYSCRIGLIKQGSHDIRYGYAGVPGIGTQVGITDPEYMYLTGTTTQKSPGNIAQEIKFSAVNEYHTIATSSFMLKVNDYCGDGIKQWPNTEGKGGVRNDGYESCDGSADVATSVVSSSKTRQYACNTTTIAKTPYPIISTNHCIFKSPLDGGGYCGDTYCQAVSNETIGNCPFDCSPVDYGNSDTLGSGSGGPSNNNCNTNGIDCDPGYRCNTAGTCEKLCWPKSVTRTVNVREGDAPIPGYYKTWISDAFSSTMYGFTYNSSQINNKFISGVKECVRNDDGSTDPSPLVDCTIVKINNPICLSKWASDVTTGSCPSGYQFDNNPVTRTLDWDKCRQHDNLVCVDCWRTRLQWGCKKQISNTVCYLDNCTTTNNQAGTIDPSGNCVAQSTPPPNTCNPACGGGYSCVNGQCVYNGGTNPPPPPNPNCKACDFTFCGNNGCGETCPCSGGEYRCNVVTSSCVLPCRAGTAGTLGYASQYNVPCVTCVAGTYNTVDQSATCDSCPSGNYCTGGTNLTPCPSGTARSTTGGVSLTNCTRCAAGTYADTTGSTSCTQCSAGTYADTTGSTSCTQCSAGTYASTTGSTSCTRCAAGTYNKTTGNSSCTICEANYYCPGASVRMACRNGYVSQAGSDASSDCRPPVI
jgi:hypothetical protein